MDKITLSLERNNWREGSVTVDSNVKARRNRSETWLHLCDLTKPTIAGIHVE
jgi:hypothetical protein